MLHLNANEEPKTSALWLPNVIKKPFKRKELTLKDLLNSAKWYCHVTYNKDLVLILV